MFLKQINRIIIINPISLNGTGLSEHLSPNDSFYVVTKAGSVSVQRLQPLKAAFVDRLHQCSILFLGNEGSSGWTVRSQGYPKILCVTRMCPWIEAQLHKHLFYVTEIPYLGHVTTELSPWQPANSADITGHCAFDNVNINVARVSETDDVVTQTFCSSYSCHWGNSGKQLVGGCVAAFFPVTSTEQHLAFYQVVVDLVWAGGWLTDHGAVSLLSTMVLLSVFTVLIFLNRQQGQ